MPDGKIEYTKVGCDKAIGWSDFVLSTSQTPILQLKNAVFGSDVNRSMLVTAYVDNSLDYWVGIVSWKQSLQGSEGVVYNTLSNKGLALTFINQYGAIAVSETCSLRARAI